MRKWLITLCLAALVFAGGMTAPGQNARAEDRRTAYRQVGAVVSLGSYEQNNDPSDGPEEIEWIVLDVKEGKSLLLSQYALDAQPYHTEYKDITWAACTLRAWLNEEFLSAAFSPEELAAIPEVLLDNGPSQGGGYTTEGGEDTLDRVFLLSYADADRYFGDDMARRCLPTEYAVARGAYLSDSNRLEGKPCCLWWLRSPGNQQHRASAVYSGGGLNYTYATKAGGCVRPAVWLDPELLGE